MSTDVQQAVIRLARARGLNPATLTGNQYKLLVATVYQQRGELLGAAGRAAASQIRTSLGRTVHLSVYKENRAKCEACPKFGQLRDGTILCGACGCSGRLLESKLQDPLESCPLGNWTNDGRPLARDDVELTDGDSVSVGVTTHAP